MKLHEIKLTDVIPSGFIDHKKLAKETKHELEGEDLDAVKYYTSDSFKLNHLLHSVHVANKMPLDIDSHRLVKNAKILNKLIHDHPIKKNLTLYSGVSFDVADLWKMRKVDRSTNATIHVPSFTSCSSDLSQALQFSNPMKTAVHTQHSKHERLNDEDEISGREEFINVIMFKVNAGDPVLSIAEHSYSPDEFEYLLPADCSISIKPNPLKKNYTSHKNLIIWEGTITFGSPDTLENKLSTNVKVPSSRFIDGEKELQGLSRLYDQINKYFGEIKEQSPDEWRSYWSICQSAQRRFEDHKVKHRAIGLFCRLVIFGSFVYFKTEKPIPSEIVQEIKTLAELLEIKLVDLTAEYKYSEFSRIMSLAELHECTENLIES